MVGIVRQRTHIGSADIQDMFGIARVIGGTTTDLGPSLDQRDAKPEFRILQKLIGEQHAARTAADDDRMPCCETAHEPAPRFAMKINATTFASLPILARKLRWQFEKTIILQTMLAKVQDFREPA